MKCPHCNAPMPDGNKFCTQCGTRLAPLANNSAASPENSSFHNENTSRPSEPALETNLSDHHHLDTTGKLRNMAQWRIADGEIARKISEIDFANISTISGIIIQPGVTALIYIDGKEALQLNSGLYNFVSEADVEQIMNMRVESDGISGWVKAKWRSLIKLVLGAKVHETEKINDRKLSVPEIIAKLNENSLIAVYLKRDIDFPSIYGSVQTADHKVVFEPMSIKTKLLDAKIGLQMFLRIADFNRFIRRYLAADSSVTTSDIQLSLSTFVRNILQEELLNEAIEEYGIRPEARERIKNRLGALTQYADGIEFVRLAEISCSNEALDRFRALTQELYCNERELDFLHRTNEFKNRMARENNAEAIAHARNDEELDSALKAINRDKLLNEDELEAFKNALEIKQIGRATEKEAAQLESKTVLALKQMEGMERTAAIAHKLEEEKLQHSRRLKQTELGMRRDDDAYADEREAHRMTILRQRLEMALDVDQKINDQEQANLDKEHARKAELMDKELTHKEMMARIMKEYSAEQLTANQISLLDAAAQVEFAKTLASKNESAAASAAANATREIYEKEMDRQRDRETRMQEFMEKAMRMNAAVAGARIDQAETLQDKYREDASRYRDDARYQQERLEHSQDKALEYTTRSSAQRDNDRSGEARQKPSPTVRCPRCDKEIASNAKFCGFCGFEFE